MGRRFFPQLRQTYDAYGNVVIATRCHGACDHDDVRQHLSRIPGDRDRRPEPYDDEQLRPALWQADHDDGCERGDHLVPL